MRGAICTVNGDTLMPVSRPEPLTPESRQIVVNVVDTEAANSATSEGIPAKNIELNPWVKPAVLLALRTAMRRGEILNLRWEHVDWTGRCVHLPATKNGSSRDVPLSNKAALVLRRLFNGQSVGPVFPTTTSAFKQVFADAMTRSRVQNLRFHDFRHDATTRLAGKLVNVLELSAVTGHKSLAMLKRYYNPKASDLAQKLD